MPGSPNHAWSGRLPALVAEPIPALLGRLLDFLPDAGPAQERAWRQEIEVLQAEGAHVLELEPEAQTDSAVLEYMLPREAGRRPDVLVLQNGRVVVFEFKETGQARRSAIDQVQAYARDLAAYHEACEELAVTPVLVLCGEGAKRRTVDGVEIVPAAELGRSLLALGRIESSNPIDLPTFLAGEYAPLPSLVAAARLLFDNLPLPFVKRAQSAGVHTAVKHVIRLARQARAEGSRHLVLLTGVPGAGKTLVGLQVAHHAALEEGFRFGPRKKRGAPATFLSGNGPLVQVLQQALKSTAFVQDMHRYIREYGLEHPDRVPPERLVVFDEAQRAWDEAKVADFYRKKLPHLDSSRHWSEPRLLVDIADRLEDWAVVLALVGEGQEIHTGEEGGLGQWVEAIARSRQVWSIHGPEALGALFAGASSSFHAEAALNLDTTLRSHAASDIHRWVHLVLDRGDLDAARPLAERLRREGFPIYVTRSLDTAKQYALDRFAAEPMRRYGILASSKAKNLDEFGLDPGFQETKRIQVGHWFNDGPQSARSCCKLDTVITEFQCQGLELDLPIICWGDDFWWYEAAWQSRVGRTRKLVRDPHRLRTNTYRVLLTRGREGLVLVVPLRPDQEMSASFTALVSGGALELRTHQLSRSA